jgi:hypothetical protein
MMGTHTAPSLESTNSLKIVNSQRSLRIRIVRFNLKRVPLAHHTLVNSIRVLVDLIVTLR